MNNKCTNCGFDLKEGNSFCDNCGAKIENTVQPQNGWNSMTAPSFSPEVPITPEMSQQNNISYQQNTINIQNPNMNSSIPVQPATQPQIIVTNQQPSTFQQSQKKSTKKDGKATASFIIGIVTLVLSFLLNVYTIPFSFLGLILAIVAEKGSSKKIAGIVLNSISMLLSIIIYVVLSILIAVLQPEIDKLNPQIIDDSNLSTFVGTGYSIKYDSPWVEATLDTGVDVLRYGETYSYFTELSKNKYSSEYTCDFTTTVCQDNIYSDYEDYWNKTLSDIVKVEKDKKFILLKNGMYYAQYKFESTYEDSYGTFYLVVSTKDDAILSFAVKKYDKYSLEEETSSITLLKTLEID